MNPQDPSSQDPMLINPQPDQQPPVEPGLQVGGPSPVPAADSMFQPIMPSRPPQTEIPSMQPQGPNMTPIPGATGGYPVPEQPYMSGQPPQPMTKLPTPPKKSSTKKPLLVAGIGIGLLVIISVVVIVLGGGKKQTPVATDQTEQAQGPQPAQAIDVEQTNNSINQDVTGFDNTKDFPDNLLEDSQLGL